MNKYEIIKNLINLFGAIFLTIISGWDKGNFVIIYLILGVLSKLEY